MPFSIDPFEQARFYLFSLLSFFILIFQKDISFYPKNFTPFHLLNIYLFFHTLFYFFKNFSFFLLSHLFFYFSFWIFLNIFNGIEKKDGLVLLKFISFVGLLEGIYGIFQYLNRDPIFSLVEWAKEERLQVAGTIGIPAIFGIFLSITLIVQIYLFINLKKTIYLLLFFPTFISLIFNNTRTAIFGFIISSIFIIFKELKRRGFFIIGILIFFTLSLIFLNKNLNYRWKELLDFNKTHSASIRAFYWKVSLEIIKEKPFWGYEAGSFSRVYFEEQRKLLLENKIKKPEVIQAMLWAHNDFLQIWVEYGFLGFLLFFISLLWIIFKKNLNPLSKAGGILAFFSSIFLFPFYNPSTLFLFFLIFLLQNQDLKF